MQHHPFVPFSASHNPLSTRPGLFAGELKVAELIPALQKEKVVISNRAKALTKQVFTDQNT